VSWTNTLTDLRDVLFKDPGVEYSPVRHGGDELAETYALSDVDWYHIVFGQ
jgi:hypothetical protein